MKNKLKINVLIVVLFFITLKHTNNEVFEYTEITIFSSDVNKTDDLEIFLKRISKKESNNRLGIISKNGHIGKYQFSPKTLSWLGCNDIDFFLKSEKMQNEVMIKYLKKNKYILRNVIKKWDGKEYKGNVITESGILASAHLVGPGGVIEFFNTLDEIVDGNGVKITEYLIDFSGYRLDLD